MGCTEPAVPAHNEQSQQGCYLCEVGRGRTSVLGVTGHQHQCVGCRSTFISVVLGSPFFPPRPRGPPDDAGGGWLVPISGLLVPSPALLLPVFHSTFTQPLSPATSQNASKTAAQSRQGTAALGFLLHSITLGLPFLPLYVRFFLGRGTLCGNMALVGMGVVGREAGAHAEGACALGESLSAVDGLCSKSWGPRPSRTGSRGPCPGSAGGPGTVRCITLGPGQWNPQFFVRMVHI